MKLKKLMAGTMAIVSMFCISLSAMAVTPMQSAEKIQQARIAEAKAIAYMDLDAASQEMREDILEARKVIIYSEDWVADGYTAYVHYEDGTKETLPHFSEVFPGWDLPVTDVASMRSAIEAQTVLPSDTSIQTTSNCEESWRYGVALFNPSSSVNSPAFDRVTAYWGYGVCTIVDSLQYSTTCNLGYTNYDTGYDIGHRSNLREGQAMEILLDDDIVPITIAVRASTNSVEGYGDFVTQYHYDL